MRTSRHHGIAVVLFSVVGCARLLPAAPSPQGAAAFASLTHPGEIRLPGDEHIPALRVAVRSDPRTDEEHPEDAFILEADLGDASDRRPADMKFISTYGSFELAIFDLTGDRIPDIVFVNGEGRGTSARRERLRVMTVAEGRFETILDELVSGWFAPDAQWEFRRDVLFDPRSRATSLRLTLHYDELGRSRWPTLERPDLIPPERVRELAYDPATRRMTLPATRPRRDADGAGHVRLVCASLFAAMSAVARAFLP